LEQLDPEVNALDIDDEGKILAEVRIVNACAECGDELTEYVFDVKEQVTLPDEVPDHEHDLGIDEGECERTEPDHTPPRRNRKLALARYRKTYYGFSLRYIIRCRACDFEHEGVLVDDVQASRMEVLA
jgi:hypothetical protein